MAALRDPFLPQGLPDPISSNSARFDAIGHGSSLIQGFDSLNGKKRGQASRSWIRIDDNGNSMILELDKATLMRHCSLPARDLRLLDPMFIYPSTILGRERAIVVSLEQVRCIITADEVILMNSLDGSVMQYESELCKRLQSNKHQNDDLPFEFRALELALELTCMSLDAQVKEQELEIYPVLDELASSISTSNLELVRRFKGHLLALTRRVQKVRNEIEHLMEDDGDMAEMYLTEKKETMEPYSSTDQYFQSIASGSGVMSKSAPVSPVDSFTGANKLARNFSNLMMSSRHGSSTLSSVRGYNIEKLEMLLEAYFVSIDNTLSKILSLKECIDDTEDFINIKLANVQNRLIQFELLLAAATFGATMFAVVTGVFGMNLAPGNFGNSSSFNWALIITGVACVATYLLLLLYFKIKRILPV
ncbi:hypothetical protein GIB67_000625 [Kingdonia uniflora]|uniref:Magnesium transporter n=1 Tax=Kingdonia uniflora TaxID=39325 RepID=A0A7J7NCS1_9MAGN|nr:hypothetical protein GIB67_000625 [Kingdonia uniflora]